MANQLPIQLATRFDVAAPGSDTSILAANLTPPIGATRFIVAVTLSTSSVFNVVETDGTTTHVQSMNSAVALVANAMYEFEFGINQSNTYNFRVATNGVIERLIVEALV